MLGTSEDDDGLRSELGISDTYRSKLSGVMEAATVPFVAFCASQLRTHAEGYETFSPMSAYNGAVKLRAVTEKVCAGGGCL